MLQQLGDAKIHEVLAKLLGPQPTQDDGVTEESWWGAVIRCSGQCGIRVDRGLILIV